MMHHLPRHHAPPPLPPSGRVPTRAPSTSKLPREAGWRADRARRRRRGRLAAAALLAALLLDMLFVGAVMPRVIYHRKRQAWVRLMRGSDWPRAAARKAALPRYAPPPGAPFFGGAKVLSLRRSVARRAHAAAQLGAAGVPYEFVDAVDGLNASQLAAAGADIARYVAGARLAKFRAGPAAHPNARFKVACDLSHYRLMHALLAGAQPAQLVLEDDLELAGPPETWAARLNATLAALPADWDVLQLHLCQAALVPGPPPGGGPGGPGVRLFSRGFCTLGLAYTRAGALKALRAAETGQRNVDNVLFDLVETGALASYAADPFLVRRAAGFPSEIDGAGGKKDDF